MSTPMRDPPPAPNALAWFGSCYAVAVNAIRHTNDANNSAAVVDVCTGCSFRAVRELNRIVDYCGLATVSACMHYVQANAEAAVRRVIDRLHDGAYNVSLDDGYDT